MAEACRPVGSVGSCDGRRRLGTVVACTPAVGIADLYGGTSRGLAYCLACSGRLVLAHERGGVAGRRLDVARRHFDWTLAPLVSAAATGDPALGQLSGADAVSAGDDAASRAADSFFNRLHAADADGGPVVYLAQCDRRGRGDSRRPQGSRHG